jgi:hypothetical protein
MSVIPNKDARTDVGPKPATTSVLHWPEAITALGLWLTIVWTVLLGYGAFKLIELAI